MQRNFFEYKQLRKDLIEKFSDAESAVLSTDDEKFNYLRYLLYKIGESYYVSVDIKLEDIANSMRIWFEEEHDFKVDQTELSGIKILNIKKKKVLQNFLEYLNQLHCFYTKIKHIFLLCSCRPNGLKNPK